MAVQPIPDGFHSVTPYLIVTGAARLIAFLTVAFEAEELERTTRPDGSVANARLRIGDSMVMVADATPDQQARPSSLYLYVPDTDVAWRRAMEAGGASLMSPADMFFGDRNAGVMDALGNHWWIATHIEDVEPFEMARRASQAFRPGQQQR